MRQVNYTRIAELLQAPFLLVVIYWFLFYPPPGYAVALLALAAAIMAVRTDHFTRTERVVWILLAGALCFIEFRAISKDRDEHDKQEAEIRWRDEFSRKQERRQFSALIDSGKILLSTEQHLSMTTMDALTGGESFCYLEVRSFGGENVLEALLLQKGSNPLFNVDVEVTDIDVLKPPIDFAALSKARSNFSVPFVSSPGLKSFPSENVWS